MQSVLNGKNAKGHVPLHLAVCNARREKDAVKALLDKGADPSARDGNDETPMHVVARLCDHKGEYEREQRPSTIPTAKMLIQAGADLSAAAGSRGVLPLHVAAAAGNVKLVELLLAKGANVDALDNEGATPLHHAVGQAQARTVLALVEGGASPALSEGAGKLPADMATGRDSSSSSIRKYLADATQLREKFLQEKAKKKEEKKAKASAGKVEL